MIAWLSALPRWQMYAGFLALALVRGLGYYLAGRLATARVAEGGRMAEARERVRAVGARSVAMTYPVYGLAGATQMANGAAHVPLGRFYVSLLPVAAIWAGLQTALGVVVLDALVSQAAPWVLGVVAVAVVARLVVGVRRRHAA